MSNLKRNSSSYSTRKQPNLNQAFIQDSLSLPDSDINFSQSNKLNKAFILYSDDQLMSVGSSSQFDKQSQSNLLGSLANQQSSIFQIRANSQCSQSAKQLFQALEPLFRKNDNNFTRKSPRFYSEVSSQQQLKEESFTSKSKNMSIQYQKSNANTVNTQILQQKYEQPLLCDNLNLTSNNNTNNQSKLDNSLRMSLRSSKKIILQQDQSTSVKQHTKKQKKIKKNQKLSNNNNNKQFSFSNNSGQYLWN